VICGAGLSAALPGVVAAHTRLPVIGVPLNAALGGLDALLSVVQMPPGVPVACVGIDNARNAAHLATADPATGAACRMRVGLGYDSHRFAAGTSARPRWGVTIDHSAGLVGHSDADAVAHAVTDAVLGAAGLGDIGRHFPPTDERWRTPTPWICFDARASSRRRRTTRS
jgi:hypothetical protein